MNFAIIYMIKAALFMAAFYLVYAILLSRDTSYGRNRIFIIMSVLLSMILPLITIETHRQIGIQYFGKILDEVFITASAEEIDASGNWLSGASIIKTITLIYLTVAILLFVKLLADLVNLLIMISGQKERGNRIIRFHTFNTSGFSAMGYIFLNSRLTDYESKEIIRHEENHLRYNHFIDIILIEVIRVIQWFNPAVYMFDRSLRAVHEYQADQGCLKAGVTVASYQSLIINQVFRSKLFNLTNSFSNPSMVRKRMMMMTKKKTPSLANLKLLMTIPVTGIIFLAVSAYSEIPDPPKNNLSTEMYQTNLVDNDLNEIETIPETKPFSLVDEMPAFPGGDNELITFIAKNTIYPEAAKINNVHGRVVVRFCVNENGSIDRISILQGVSPELDQEALRVIETLPDFKPGLKDGKPVPVWYMLPITFALK